MILIFAIYLLAKKTPATSRTFAKYLIFAVVPALIFLYSTRYRAQDRDKLLDMFIIVEKIRHQQHCTVRTTHARVYPHFSADTENARLRARPSYGEPNSIDYGLRICYFALNPAKIKEIIYFRWKKSTRSMSSMSTQQTRPWHIPTVPQHISDPCFF